MGAQHTQTERVASPRSRRARRSLVAANVHRRSSPRASGADVGSPSLVVAARRRPRRRSSGSSRVVLVAVVARAVALVSSSCRRVPSFGREADGRVHLELHRREELLDLAGEVRVLEEVAHLLRDDAEEPVLRLVDLLEEVVRDLLRQLQVADELLQVVRRLLRLLDADLDRARTISGMTPSRRRSDGSPARVRTGGARTAGSRTARSSAADSSSLIALDLSPAGRRVNATR